MFQWAQSTFDKLSQTVAPPPEDGPARFAYLVQRGEEDAAMGCIASMDPVYTVVNQAKGQYPIHLACQYSCMRLLQLLLNQPGMNIGQTDLNGNTPLHYASMSTEPNGLEVVKLLIGTFGTSIVLAKNAQGETPYDVATKNTIRQHLLPIQLQAETQIALDNGGQGLPPGIDMGGLRIHNPSIAPPPTFGGGGGGLGGTPGQQQQQPLQMGGGPPGPGGIPGMPPPGAGAGIGIGSPAAPPNMPAPHLFGTPSPSQPHRSTATASAPSPSPQQQQQELQASDSSSARGKSHEYSRVGSSSAAMSGVGKYRADGFHSSSSDVSLQRKYGHATVSNSSYGGRTIAPPPSSGNGSLGAAIMAQNNNNSSGVNGGGGGTPSPSSGGGPNPFSAGGAAGGRGRYGALNGRSRYVTYGQVATSPAAATAAPGYGAYPATAPVGGNVSLFTPGGGGGIAAATSPSSYGATPTSHSAPTSAGAPSLSATSTPTTPYMPPPPYQSHNYEQQQQQQGATTTMHHQNSANMADAQAQDIFAAPSPQKESVHAAAAAVEPSPAVASNYTAESVNMNMNTTTPATAAATTTTDESADWVETVDPSSGQTYYYNTVTHETSWEKPTDNGVASTHTGGTNPLADNWVETVDPSSGLTYYYNSVTHETSWEKPALAASTTTTTTTTTTPEAEVTTTTAAAAAAASSEVTTPITPAPVSASDAFSAPSPSAADAFGAPPPFETSTSPTAEAAFESSAPTPAPVCASDAFLAPAPSAVDAFVAPPPNTEVMTTTMTTPVFGGAHQRSISADELFAEDPPTSENAGVGDENDTTPVAVTPQKAEPSHSTEQQQQEHEAVDGDGLMDDVPLSPTSQQQQQQQQPRPETTTAPANGELVPPLGHTGNAPTNDSGADSLFAAIGMPPPPFSARKR